MTSVHQLAVLCCFVVTYSVMATGKVPGLRIDRAGVAVAAAGLLLALSIVTPAELILHLDLPVLFTLFSLMTVGAHLERTRAFDLLANRLISPEMTPHGLLAASMGLSALLSVFLVNDIVVYTLTPILCQVCLARGSDPKPHLLGMAGASNAGSAASLIGNPQNILIAEMGNLSFLEYVQFAAIPALLSLCVLYGVVRWVFRESLRRDPGDIMVGRPLHPFPETPVDKPAVLMLAAGLLFISLAYLFVPGRGWQVALLVAMLIMVFGRLNTRETWSRIDTPLLLLIAGLMVVTGEFSGLPQVSGIMNWLAAKDLLPTTVLNSAVFSVLASNTIGNVPAVVLLLNLTDALDTHALHLLALFSTLAGNLLLTGSLANIITAERASQNGVRLGFIEFARVGLPATLLSMVIAALWVTGF